MKRDDTETKSSSGSSDEPVNMDADVNDEKLYNLSALLHVIFYNQFASIHTPLVMLLHAKFKIGRSTHTAWAKKHQ